MPTCRPTRLFSIGWLIRTAIPREQIEAQAIYPDEGATYAAEYDLNLDRLEPLVACPHSVDNVQPLSTMAGQHVDMAFIGTCTNGRLEDLAAAAQVLRGQLSMPARACWWFPASNQVYLDALREGYLEVFIKAGAAIGVPGCGPCMGNHLGIPAAGEVVISSANRNFKGRMGQPDASIYLAAPAVVAASAVLGRIGGPAELDPSLAAGPHPFRWARHVGEGIARAGLDGAKEQGQLAGSELDLRSFASPCYAC